MPAGYRPGIPQQPYTKYESDNEEIKVEYKRVDSCASSLAVRNIHWFSGYKGAVLRILLFIVVFLLGLILGYIVRRNIKEGELLELKPKPCVFRAKMISYDLTDDIDRIVSKTTIKDSLSQFSSLVHITGTSGNNQLREIIESKLQDLHFNVRRASYKALLSYPEWERLSSASLLDGNGSVVYETVYRGPSTGLPGFRAADHPEITEPFVAYSANGTVEGEPVYANYGEEKDFSLLKSQGIKCNDKIVIMRYGRISVKNMIRNAARCHAAAVLLYPDPADFSYDAASRQAHELNPGGPGLPGWASRTDNLWGFGDPLSSDLPSVDGMFRSTQDSVDLPQIPVQPISSDDALRIMAHMKGPVEAEFIGGLQKNVTYSMGSGYTAERNDWKVRVEVHNELETREITNTFGLIRGKEEPDRYVIIGCHYDSLTYGASDTGSGLAIIMELAKTLSQLSNEGWQPRRTIVLSFWDASEMGQIGSFEWVKDHEAMLAERVVAYINLDEAITGGFSLDVESSPMLHSVLINATKRVKMAPGDESNISDQSQSLFTNEYSPDTPKTVYDLWRQRSPSDISGNHPRIKSISPDSDHTAFAYLIGAPVLWPRFVSQHYVSSENSPIHPAYHTTLDKFEYLAQFIDPDLQAHVTLTKVVSEIVLELCGRERIGLDVRELAEWLENEYNALQQDGLQEFKSALYYLQRAIGIFSETADIFQDNFLHLNTNSDVLELRQYNDRLIQASRAFISHLAYRNNNIRNLLFAPSNVTSYKYTTFTAVRDSFSAYLAGSTTLEKQQARSLVEKQISLLTQAVRSANQILTDGDDSFQ